MGALPPKDQTAHEWLNDFAVAWRADAKNTDGRVAEADVSRLAAKFAESIRMASPDVQKVNSVQAEDIKKQIRSFAEFASYETAEIRCVVQLSGTLFVRAMANHLTLLAQHQRIRKLELNR